MENNLSALTLFPRLWGLIVAAFLFFTTGIPIPVSYQIFGTSGIITSPNFPDFYPDYIIRLWNITVPSGKQIALNFTFFHLSHPSVTCDRDFVLIQDGALPSSDVIVRLCGQQSKGKTVFSSGQHLQIYFETDAVYSYTGFQAIYKAVSK